MSTDSLTTARPATLLRRLGAMFYDTMLLFAILFFAGLLYAWINHGDESAFSRWYYTVYLLAISWFFFCGFWVNAGQTLGMQTWGLHVQTLEGERPGWLAATRRFFASILSLLAAGLGFLWILANKDRLAWHDRLSATRIVYIPSTSAKNRQE